MNESFKEVDNTDIDRYIATPPSSTCLTSPYLAFCFGVVRWELINNSERLSCFYAVELMKLGGSTVKAEENPLLINQREEIPISFVTFSVLWAAALHSIVKMEGVSLR